MGKTTNNFEIDIGPIGLLTSQHVICHLARNNLHVVQVA